MAFRLAEKRSNKIGDAGEQWSYYVGIGDNRHRRAICSDKNSSTLWAVAIYTARRQRITQRGKATGGNIAGRRLLFLSVILLTIV